MATTLTSQLAQIRAQSTNSLDLKAQKKSHSQSLLFDPLVAATQDFDSIYQICWEGFEDLCRLDTRFITFADNIFSEQSKHEDRTQMTALQNQQLDMALEEFLCLIGSKLLLKPALKALEWLVRRFRVHEKNTVCLVLTFLPYHTTAMFSTILSILPQTMPPTLKFLHPYIQSLANPPRHTVVYTATNSRPFIAALSTYVLSTSRLGYQYSTLTSFWATVASEAVSAMLDQARSARRESRKQNQEDVILFMLPILNDGLSPGGALELRVACYMVLTVLASKANLNDSVLTAIMEAVTLEWDRTSHAGLICLCVLAQQRETAKLPRRVFKAVVALEKLDDDLMSLQKLYRVEKLVMGVILGIISGLKKAQDASKLRLIRTLIEAGLMDDVYTAVVVKSILKAAQSMTPEANSTFDAQGSLADLVLRLADSKSIGKLVQSTIKESEINFGHWELRFQEVICTTGSTPDRIIEDVDMEDPGVQPVTENFDAVTSRIPTRTAYEISFLSHSDSYVFGSLANTFLSVSVSDVNVEKFSDLPVLRKSLATSEPLYLSFYIRFWCGNSQANARAAAIRTVSKYMSNGALTTDVQILLPYLIYALADPFPKVRRAATQLVLVLARAYREADGEAKHENLPILGQEQIYGQGKESKAISWLSMGEIHQFMEVILVPGVEECLVDAGHISQLLSDSLNGPKHNKASNKNHKGLKTSLQLAIFSCLCSHVVNMPLFKVKFRVLKMLNQITKVGSTSRTKVLLPLLSKCADQSTPRLEVHEQMCKIEELDPGQFLKEVVAIVIPGDREGVHALKDIIQSEIRSPFASLKAAALHRTQAIWQFMKSDLQTSFAKVLLEQAVMQIFAEENGGQEVETLETLRALPLSTSILQSFVEGLPSVSSLIQDKPSPSKRRRTSHGHSTETTLITRDGLALAIKQITLVLELVEDAEPERHPELLKGLFQVVSDLQHPQGQSKAATDYLLVLAMDSILSIVKADEGSTAIAIDYSAVRTDVLIDCIRTTASPQVRNTALLLVSALATVASELVLHSVMPIFTFMGASVFRQDNDFSTYVVKQTMEAVIPRLVQSLRERKEGSFLAVSELLLSFAAAFEHIPTQRRLDLFTSLVDRVGPCDYLFALLAIMVDKYPDNRKVLQFAADLTGRYDVKIRLRMIEKYLEVILDAQKAKPTLSTSLLMINKDRTVEHATANLLNLPLMVLSDAALVSRINRKLAQESDDAAIIRSSYTRVLEEIFLLSEYCKGTRRLDALCMRALDASLGLLPMSELADTLQSLLERTEDNVRRQVLRSFANCLNETKMDQRASQVACLASLPRLLSIIRESPDVTLKEIAINCLNGITEKFGRKDIAAVINSAQTISGDHCLGAAEKSLRVTSLLCLATIVEILGDSCIAIIPSAFTKAIESLTSSIEEDTNDTSLHNAVYTFFSTLLLFVPWVITGSDLDHLLKVSYESASAEMDDECDQRRMETLTLISKQIEASECFAALKRTWTDAMAEGPLATKEYLKTLRLAIDRHPKPVIVKHSEKLGNLFLRTFDLRRIQRSPPVEDSYTMDEIDEVEDAVNESVIAMVYKLNDATFRPLFSRMLEWATSSDSEDKSAIIHRQATWYNFLLKFFDTLKSIVTGYAGFVIDDSVKILHQTSSEDENSMFLWRRVIATLHKTFEHDQDDFYQSPSHFTPIFTALLSQLTHAAKIPLLPELIPAIVELAVATDSATHHKEMNTAVLQHMRSDSAAVRLAAVQCAKSLTERLGEEWLALLPEMLPFISEALEDDDEAVEREVQRWVTGIEGMLGESLNPMLQ